MKNFKSVAIVVLNWNGAKILEDAINSLLKQDYSSYKIIIVDNGSIDSSRDIITKIKAKNTDLVEVILNDTNLGFAGGVNVGIKYALDNNFHYVALFNNDAVAQKDWLSNLLSSFDSASTLGAVTGLLLHRNGKTIDSTGDWYSYWGLPFPRNRDEPVQNAPQSGFIFGASGGATLYKTEMFKEIGMLDDRFFAYFEDVDISFRAQIAGYKFYFNKEAIAYHIQGATSSKFPGFGKYQMFKNLPQLYFKNVPTQLLLPIGIRFFPILLAFFIRSLFNYREAWPAIKGMFASFLLIAGSIQRRHAIYSKKKVEIGYIKSIIWPGLPPRMLRKLRKLFGLTYKSTN